MASSDGHAFICYVRENSDEADRVTALLTAAGIPIWRDTENLWPGEDWRERIRDAITSGAFAFIPIFTSISVAKGVSGQNEELYLAAEEMRRRQPGEPWIFPVRFDDCRLPRLRLGGGRTLDDIQRADVFGLDEERQARRLVEAVKRIIDSDGRSEPPDVASPSSPPIDGTAGRPRLERDLKDMLRDPAGDIRLYDFLIPIASAVYDELANGERYPVDGTATVEDIVEQVNRYWIDLDGLLDTLVISGMWAREDHLPTLTDAVQRVARSSAEYGGNVARLAVRAFPLSAIVYTAGLAALTRSNYSLLHAIALDARVRELNGSVPVVVKAQPWTPFDNFDLPAQMLALEASGEEVDKSVVAALANGQRGKRYTPASDHLHDRLRDRLRLVVPDDEDYSELFDRLELLLALLVVDLQNQQPDGQFAAPYIGGPFVGRFSWRDRHAEAPQRIEQRLMREMEAAGEGWAPLSGGLFGRSTERAKAAFEVFLPHAEKVRSSRW